MASVFNPPNFFKIMLLTGEPGVGKTTLIKKLYDRLKQESNKQLKGFYTKEIRDEFNTRIGFDVIDINDESKRSILARISEHSNRPKVGKYSVDVQSFEGIALPLINNISENTIYLIDEIGKMEMFSSHFESSILNMMHKISTQAFLIIATVPSRNLSLSDKLKSHPCAKLFTVTFQNRNKLIDDVYDLVIQSSKKI